MGDAGVNKSERQRIQEITRNSIFLQEESKYPAGSFTGKSHFPHFSDNDI
jgi:hypothetical protein